jgi:hypothetical protein
VSDDEHWRCNERIHGLRDDLRTVKAENERLRAVVDAVRPLVLTVDEMMASAARPVDVKEPQFLRVRQALGTIYQYAIDHPEGHLRIGEAT